MSLSSVTLPVSPTPPQGSLGVQRGDTVTPLLLCVPTVAGDSGNGSVTHPAPGPGFSQHLLSQGGNGETRFRVKTNISTVQSKSPFNTSPDTGGEAPDSFFLLSTFRLPPAAQRNHGAENETLPPEQTLCAQPRGTERSDTSDSTGGVCHGPKQQSPHPKARLLQDWEPLARPSTISQMSGQQRLVSRVHPAAFWIRIMASQLLAPS